MPRKARVIGGATVRRLFAIGLLGLSAAAPLAGSGARASATDSHAAANAPKPCKPLVADILAGTVNRMGPATPLATVKKRLPCATGGTPEGDLYNHGGGAFFTDHNLYFYTYLRFIELRAPFNGTTSIPVFGRPRPALMAELQQHGRSERPNWATADDEFLTMRFGCLQLTFAQDRASRLRFFTRPCGNLYNPR